MKKVWYKGERRIMYTHEEAQRFAIEKFGDAEMAINLGNLIALKKNIVGFVYKKSIIFYPVYEEDITEMEVE